MKGKIKTISQNRGFGLIRGENGKDIFFNRYGLKKVTFKSLKENEQVEFDMDNDTKTIHAVNVRKIVSDN